MKKIIILLFTSVIYIHANANAQNVDQFLATNPSIFQIKANLKEHKFSCEELIAGYINRIKLYNLTAKNKASLNAIAEINPNALVDAKKLDLALTDHNTEIGSLFCVPVLVKDNIDVKGMRTSSGSLGLLGTYPLSDAKMIRDIKQQGGVILAKSSMNELVSGIDGMSSLNGRIGNAYNTSYNSGGSSGGSAVGVAAGFAPISIGSDNSGSIRIPAAYNGIYGLRPTYGLIGHEGVFPLGNLDGTFGPMANNVSDLAVLLTVMANNKTNYVKNLDASSLSGKHFAIVTSFAGESLWDGVPPSISAIYKKVIANLKKSGVIISKIDLPKYDLERKYSMSGEAEEINDYLAQHISNISQFSDICYTNSHVYGTQKDCLAFIGSIKSKNSLEYKQGMQIISKNQSYLLDIMHKEHLDGLIFPSGKSGVASYNWKQIGNVFTLSSNSGLPEITIPVAQYNGLPVGLEILGKKHDESALLDYAFAYQEHYYSFKAPALIADYTFNNWSVQDLNILYPTIGTISFNTIIKHTSVNKISAKQSIVITQKAIEVFESRNR